MQQETRVRNASRNVVFGMFLKGYQILLPFTMRTAIMYYMGDGYLGLNSLFGSVLWVLNLAELGVGSAMVYSMYQPIIDNDKEHALLTAPEEKELIHHLASYTNEIESAAKDYDPTKITRYVTQLATLFHKFYNACRVKGEDEALTQARLALCESVKVVIKNVLTMFNISCPESM